MTRKFILLGGIMLAALAVLLVKRSPSNDSRHSENDPPGRAVENAAATAPDEASPPRSRSLGQPDPAEMKVASVEASRAATSVASPQARVHSQSALPPGPGGFEDIPEVTAEPAVADCDTGREHDLGLAANNYGNFPRVFIERGAVVPVTVTYPETAAGEIVEVSVEDGGSLDGRDVSRALYLDGQGRVQFAFHASESLGSFRVTLRHGTSLKTLRFWAGPPQEIARTPLLHASF